MTPLDEAARTIVESCLGVRASETVLVLADPPKRPIAEALVDRARSIGAEAVLVEMSERATHGSPVPDAVAAAMLRSDVVIAPTSWSVSHTEARAAATAAGVRIATMPTVTEEVLARAMAADPVRLAARSRAVAEVLTAGDEVRLTGAGGTDLTASIAGRTGLADTGDLTAPGAFGNLPAGEGFVAPVEGTASGTIAFDGSLAPLGLLSAPIVVRVEEGRVVDARGPRAAEWVELLGSAGGDALAVAELGIGTNETARVVGVTIEDEKVLGTVHVAFGDNHSIGGRLRAPSHQDGVVLEPELAVDGRVVLRAGSLAL